MAGVYGTHECPHPQCTVVVPNRLFACLPHWQALPQGVRIVITNTRFLSIHTRQRRDAIEDAFAAWDVRANIDAMGADAYAALVMKIDQETGE